jgi:hypothetical protein
MIKLKNEILKTNKLEFHCTHQNHSKSRWITNNNQLILYDSYTTPPQELKYN